MDQYSSIDKAVSGNGNLPARVPVAVVSLAMFLCAILLLMWNESRYEEAGGSLNHAASRIIPLNDVYPQDKHEGQLVWISAEVQGGNVLEDHDFGVKAHGLKMRRRVEVYQWIEEPAHINSYAHALAYDKEYTYNKAWKEDLVDSKSFRKKEYENPDLMLVDGLTIYPDSARLGGFGIDRQLISSLDNYELFSAPTHLKNDRNLKGGALYLGKGTPDNPEIGDVKVWWEIIPEGNYSILAAQKDEAFSPFHLQAGQSVHLMIPGYHEHVDMIDLLMARQEVFTWYLRVMGLVLCLFALYLLRLARSRRPVASPYSIG